MENGEPKVLTDEGASGKAGWCRELPGIKWNADDADGTDQNGFSRAGNTILFMFLDIFKFSNCLIFKLFLSPLVLPSFAYASDGEAHVIKLSFIVIHSHSRFKISLCLRTFVFKSWSWKLPLPKDREL